MIPSTPSSSSTAPREFPEESYHTPPSSPTLSRQTFQLTPVRVKTLRYPLPADRPSPYSELPWYRVMDTELKALHSLSEQRAAASEKVKHFPIEASFEEKSSAYEELDTLNENVETALKSLETLYASWELSSPKDLLVVLKLLSAAPFCGIEPLFYTVLKHLKEKAPTLDEYLLQVKTLEHEGPVLTPKGIEKVITFFKKEYSIEEPLLSCRILGALPSLILQMLARAQEGEFAAWVIYSNSFSEDKHVVPIFATYQKEKVHVFILDSQGHDVHPTQVAYTRFSKSLAVLRDAFYQDQNHIQLYSYAEKRQSGNVECSVFSLLDLKCLIEMHQGGENIVHYSWTQETSFLPKKITPAMIGEPEGTLPFFEIQILPPAMMKPTQSISKFKDLRVRYSPQWGAYNAHRFNSEGEKISETQNVETLYQKVSRYTSYNDEGIPRNLYALRKRFAYLIFLSMSVLDPSILD